MNLDQWLLMLVLIGVPLIAVKVSMKISSRVTSREIRVVIITDNSHHLEKGELQPLENSVTTWLNNEPYTASIDDMWKIRGNIIDRLKGKRKYLALFHELIPDDKQPELTAKPINKASIPVNSSDILAKIKKYRGVNPALQGQFKEAGGGLPSWVLIIALVAVLFIGLLAAAQMGFIDLPTGAAAAKKTGVILSL